MPPFPSINVAAEITLKIFARFCEKGLTHVFSIFHFIIILYSTSLKCPENQSMCCGVAR